MRKILLLMIFLVSLKKMEAIEQAEITPWYTGSLLSFNGRSFQPGVYAIQPYIFVTENYAKYGDNFSIQSQQSLLQINTLFLFFAGLTTFADCQFLVQTVSNFKGSSSSTHMGDSEALLGLQASKDIKHTLKPDIRIIFTEIFPTGKFQNLNPSNLGTDISGEGSYQTGVGTFIQKIFFPKPTHPIRLRLNFIYTFPSDFSAHGFHAYGGGPHVKDRIELGQSLIAIFSSEYSLTQNWVLAGDLLYTHTQQGKVVREQPLNQKGRVFSLPTSDQLSLAPAIEYNFSKKFGVLGGVWFTVFGRNANAFVSGSLSLIYVF